MKRGTHIRQKILRNEQHAHPVPQGIYALYGHTHATLPLTGTGSPEGVVTAVVGSLYLRSDGGAGTTLYVKESGTSTTGWVAK